MLGLIVLVIEIIIVLLFSPFIPDDFPIALAVILGMWMGFIAIAADKLGNM